MVACEGGVETENDREGGMLHTKGSAISVRLISLGADAKSIANSEQYMVDL